MLYDQEKGKSKVPKEGQCIICNQPSDVFSALGKFPFCTPCAKVAASGDEEALDKRIVWE